MKKQNSDTVGGNVITFPGLTNPNRTYHTGSGVRDLLSKPGDKIRFTRPEIHNKNIFVTLENGDNVLLPRYGTLVTYFSLYPHLADRMIQAEVKKAGNTQRIVVRCVENPNKGMQREKRIFKNRGRSFT